MKIKHLTPTPHITKLENLSRGQVFRFEKCSAPFMILPYTGDEIKAIYKYRHGGIEEIVEDIEVVTPDLYVWSEDDLDKEAYAYNDEDQELIAYLNLASGKIHLSHMKEVVIPLNAELTVEDLRAPD